MTSQKPDSSLFSSRDIGLHPDSIGFELFTLEEDPSKVVDDPLQKVIKTREEGLKHYEFWKEYGSMSKNAKNFFRMDGYRNVGAHQPLGGPRVIYEPPLHDSYSDVAFPMIKLCSLALEKYNKREGTNYKYVGLLKAYFCSISSTSDNYEIFFTASEALLSDLEDVSFQTKIRCSTEGGKLASLVEYVSKCSPSTHR